MKTKQPAARMPRDAYWMPDGTWVQARNNKEIRYITRQTTRETFEDDGKFSGQPPSEHCHYKNYEPKDEN